MKKLIVGMLIFGSFSVFSSERINFSAKKKIEEVSEGWSRVEKVFIEVSIENEGTCTFESKVDSTSSYLKVNFYELVKYEGELESHLTQENFKDLKENICEKFEKL